MLGFVAFLLAGGKLKYKHCDNSAMVTVPPYALTKPHVDPFSGLSEPSGGPAAQEVERRAQELVNEWLRHYFSGQSFTTKGSDGGDISMSLTLCEILFGTSVPSNPASKPILHTILADRRDGDGEHVGNDRVAFIGQFTWNTLVRVPAQSPASPSATASETAPALRESYQVARRVGDQFAWLVRSIHAQDLAFKGFSNIRVLSGPRPVQSGAWSLVQIVWSANVTWHQAG
jgi:hypothetical protein